MAGSTTKKVHIWRFDREALYGFVNPTAYLTGEGIELLTLAGNVVIAKYEEIKAVVFVRDFDAAIDAATPKRAFLSRPKLDGLWLRLTFRDGDVQEAVMPNNLLHVEPLGFNLIPPETTQRLWVPRQALNTVQVLGVIGGRAVARKPKEARKDQIGLFEQA
jgi:hypothetical protein